MNFVAQMCLFEDATPLFSGEEGELLTFNFLVAPLFLATFFTVLIFFKGNLK